MKRSVTVQELIAAFVQTKVKISPFRTTRYWSVLRHFTVPLVYLHISPLWLPIVVP